MPYRTSYTYTDMAMGWRAPIDAPGMNLMP